MTNREFYSAIANGTVETVLTEELIAHATQELAKMDEVTARRRESNSRKRAEREAEKAPIRAAILAAITNEPKTATTLIADAGADITPQSIPSLLKPLIEDGTVIKTDIKVKGKGTQRGYTLAQETEQE